MRRKINLSKTLRTFEETLRIEVVNKTGINGVQGSKLKQGDEKSFATYTLRGSVIQSKKSQNTYSNQIKHTKSEYVIYANNGQLVGVELVGGKIIWRGKTLKIVGEDHRYSSLTEQFILRCVIER